MRYEYRPNYHFQIYELCFNNSGDLLLYTTNNPLKKNLLLCFNDIVGYFSEIEI